MDNTSIKKIDLEELKKIELQTLMQVHTLCEQENLRYSICGGTLIGAVRHKGFIPWDDDIDIIMPRPDYNRLISYCKTHETPFRLICNQTEAEYGYLFAKAVNPNTVMIEENTNRSNVDMGVYIDIFPVDGLGNTEEEAKKNFNAMEFWRELLVAANWKQYFPSKSRAWYYEPIRFAFFLVSRFVRIHKLVAKIEKFYSKWDFDNSKYVACVCGVYRQKEICTHEEYTQYMAMEFEGTTVKGLKQFDKRLRYVYGDYMQLPPENKRVTHHMFKAYWRDAE